MGAMVQDRNGIYRYDPKASGTSFWDGKRWVDQNSGAGKKFIAQRQATADEWAANQNKAEVAEIDTQQVEDTMAENKERNASINSLAMSQAQRSPGMGRGIYQRRQGGVAPGMALAQLNSANAGALAAARKKQLQAQQTANPTRQTGQNALLGYYAALQKGLT